MVKLSVTNSIIVLDYYCHTRTESLPTIIKFCGHSIHHWSDNIKLYDLFFIMAKDVDAWSKITGIPYLAAFIDEFESIPENAPEDKLIEYIEIGWSAELNEDDNDEDLRFLDLHVVVDGIGEPKYINGVAHNKYALDFLELSSIINKQVKLNGAFEIYAPNYKVPVGDNDYVTMDFNRPLLKAQKMFTVTDVFQGLMWELSFHGNPEERRKRAKNLESDCSQTKA